MEYSKEVQAALDFIRERRKTLKYYPNYMEIPFDLDNLEDYRESVEEGSMTQEELTHFINLIRSDVLRYYGPGLFTITLPNHFPHVRVGVFDGCHS